MKITPFLDKKINIYDSEMSVETIESYEKFYKNQNDCDDEKKLDCGNDKKLDCENEKKLDCENEKKLDCHDVNKAVESNGHDSNNDQSQNLSDTNKCDSSNDSDRKRIRNLEATSDSLPCKKRKKEFEPPKLREDNRDIFCWRCHKYVVETDVIPCYFCPRVYHLKCVHIQEKPSGFWLCTECDAISAAENPDKISPALSKLQKKDLAELLMFVLKRMRQHEGSSHYENPVDLESYPDYKDYIVKPMYLALLENNVKNLKYSSCESFLADTKWMVHNSYVFNTVHSELTLYAKAMMKNAKHECDEIVNCPDCYLHANTLEEDKWFIEPCDKPHVLVWARLKGFPYWPCKVMKANGTNVDVRFFGDHNKSLVPVECCYLYSKQMPSKQKKVDELEIAIKEASQHIKRLEERFHVFQYAPLKTMYNPKEEEEQRKLLLPYHDKSFFIKVKDREKLFDPKVINNIFEDPPSYVNTDEKEEPETNTISESPNALELKNKKIVLKPHSEELSPYRLSSINRNMKSPPCSKPTIIIEDSDSDILSQNSFNHSRQPGVTGCEKLSSPCTSSKAKSIVSEKHVISPSAISLKHEHGNGTVEIAKDVNCKLNNHIFKSKMNTTNHSTEEQDNADDDSRIDLTNDKLKSDDKKICFTSEKVNRLTLTNPCLDKYNNNHFSDKLRINSNAKLINIITDNPALINNYIFKPMVVIQKLKDDVFRDYSNNISKKKEITAADKPNKAEEKCSSDIPSCDNGDKVCLNFDLLNGNLSDLVSLTKIDLDKEELSQENLSDNKEAENIDCDVLETSDGSFSSLPRQIVKSEKVDDDEQVDSDYIERLSKSFLEPSLDSNDTHHAEENGIISDSEKGSGERILVVDRENESLKKDEPRMRYNSSVHNSPNEVINLDIIEDIKKQNLEKSNGAGPGVDLIIPKTDVSRKAIYFCEKTGQFEEQDEEENEDRISLNVNSREIKSNEVEKTVGSNLVENEKLSLDNVETSYSEENIECPNSNKKCESSVKDMLQKEEHNSKSLNDFCPKGDNLGNGSLSDNSTMKEPDNHCEQSVQEKEIILQKKANGLQLHGDSDCEIIKVLYPAGSNIPKHLGLKRVKTSGGVIKKVLAGKSGMILAGSKDRQSLNTSAKRIIGTIPKKLSSKTKLSVDCLKQLNISGNPVKNNPASNCLPPSNKGAVSLKDVLNAVNMDDNEMLNLEVEAILNKLEKIEGKGRLLQVLKEELEKFQEQCKNKIEVYKNAFIEEMDSLYTMEKQRWIQETMNVSENESRMMVDEIKKKQWCILCLNEAKFHCCWSTSYCSEKCQLADWPVHTKTCTQYSMRIGDPDLRLSPELRKIFKGENDILNHKIKDLLESDRFNSNTSKMNLCSPSCSGTSMTSSSDVSAKDSMVTSPKSSTIYVQKNGSKQDIRGFDNSGNQVMKIVSNPGVYLSGMVAPPNQTKNIIHVTKHNSAKSNVVLQDQSSPGLSGNNKPVLFSVPLANRSSAHVSLGKTSYKTSGNSFNRHNTPVFKGGQKLVLPKSFLPTKVIKKTVPLLAHKNISCVQDNNNAAFMNAKPLYISMQNISRDNCESSDDLRDPLEIKNDTIPLPEQPKLLSDRNSIPSNRDTSKPAQSFLIVEKSGETAQYTYKIGFKEDIEKMSQVSVMNPLSVQKSTVCAVSPLPYPVICNTPSTSTE